MNLLIFFDRILEDYADVISAFCIPMIIGIFAFSLPLLLQTAGRIDDKYNSTLLIKVFCKDWICISFIVTLIVSLIFCLIWSISLPRFVDWGFTLNALIDNSSLILLLLSTIILIFFAVCVVYLTYVYYLPEKLLKRLKRQYYKAKKDSAKELYYESISKILFYSIKKEGEPLARELQRFYFHEFFNYRKDKVNKDKANNPVEYPDYYYDVMFDANECLCQRVKKNISWYNGSFYDFFIDEYQLTIISEKTYSFLWKCIIQSLFYEKDDFVFSYWQKAHQYADLWLDNIQPKYNADFTIVINQKDIDNRKIVRERFIEFHYALGGVLLMKGNYSLLKKIVSWSNHNIPKYVLVPETMGEVIMRFMQVDDDAKCHNPIYYEERYPFPDISGVNAEITIKRWIKRYISILFLRQYTLQEYLVCSKTLGSPNIPQTLSEKRRWNEELEILKYYVQEYLSNEQLLKKLGLQDLLLDDWYSKNNRTKPIEWIKNLELKIEDDIKLKKANQVIDPQKKDQFIKSSREILFKAFDDMKNVFSKDSCSNNLMLSFRGRFDIFDKTAFATDSDVSYINTNEVLAQCIADELRINAMNIFLKMKNKRFVLKENDLFKAIDSLSLNSNSFVILNPDINLYYYKTITKNTGLSCINDKWYYNGIKIINMPYNPYIGQSLIIIKEKDLPSIVHNDIDNSVIDKYHLVSIDNNLKIYANIIDLNIERDIKDEIYQETGFEQLEEKVLLCIDMNVMISCNNDAKCIILKVFSQFDDKGTPDTIERVKESRDFIIK